MALNHLLRPLLCQSLVRQVRSPLVATSRLSAPLLCPDTTRYPGACTRLYATKKSKAKAKGQSAKVNINSALVEDIINLDEVKEDMTAVLNALKDDFTRNLSIRTSPAEKAQEELLGKGEVTREHRENLAKMAKQFSNKAKDSLRRVRSSAITEVKRAKEGHSEDIIRLVEKQTQSHRRGTSLGPDEHVPALLAETGLRFLPRSARRCRMISAFSVGAQTEIGTGTTTTDCQSPPSSLVTLPVFKQTPSEGRMDF
ncbi:Ribosome-recycling factor [Nibea albiflora]|uniref:Ribosome-recycling factor n=1 Tax=Nibea albiflora TaxID=240163 RepID=A0ACB7F810_NIBAL|nr:Ribosome-recycling factor [Nibea albiflora]